MQDDNHSVCSRPGPIWWLAAALVLVLAGIFVAGAMSVRDEPFPRALCAALALGSLAAALACALHAARARVCAEPDGLRWRGAAHGWRFAPWPEVLDYYLALPNPLARDGLAAAALIETRAGRIAAGPDWSRRAALEDAVQRHARPAREWRLLGTRPGDTPLTFSYDTAENRLGALVMPALLAAYAAAAVYLLFIVPLARGARPLDGGPATLIGFLVMAVLLALYGVIVAAPLGLLRRTNARRQRGERVVVSPDGIRFKSRDRAVEAAWPDVTGYGTGSLRSGFFSLTLPLNVVSTRSGDFDFLPSLGSRDLLKACIAACAPGAAGSWRALPDEILPAPRPAIRAEGGHLYHYRTRSNRAFLWLAWFMAGVTVCESLWKQDRFALLAASPLALLAVAWLTWRYASAGIRTDDAGITQFAPLAIRTVPWASIRSASLGGPDTPVATVRGDGVTIRFFQYISEADGLRREIRERMEPPG